MRPMKRFILGWVLTVSAWAQTFSLEQILGSPFPTELTASPVGGTVAWVMNARGVRNVWVAEAPDYRGHAVTSYTADDGQEITNLSFTPDGKTLIYVRGSDANRAGEIPNPTSDPPGAEQAVWSVPAAGGTPRKFG